MSQAAASLRPCICQLLLTGRQSCSNRGFKRGLDQSGAISRLLKRIHGNCWLRLVLQVRALLDTQHGNPQMLPFYCRIIATLNQVFPDIGEAVVEAQKADFMHLRVGVCLPIASCHNRRAGGQQCLQEMLKAARASTSPCRRPMQSKAPVPEAGAAPPPDLLRAPDTKISYP